MDEGTAVKHREALLRAVDRVTASSVLRTSVSLCKLLRYLAQQSIDQPDAPHKEYQIATEVFSRPPDFDSRLDSVVRVQTGRLRAKLAEYYAGPGAEDDLILCIPKGAYSLSSHHRGRPLANFSEAIPPKAAADSREVTSATTRSPRSANNVMIALAFLAGVLVSSAALTYFNHRRQTMAAPLRSHVPSAPAALQVFWSPFLRGPREPTVVFSNAAFIGKPETGMRYFDPSRDSRDQIEQHYTGIGELMGLFRLERLFQQFGQQFRIKRAGSFRLDDASDNNLIFIGSPVEDLPLRHMPETREFVFRWLYKSPDRHELAIVNLHPGPGETSVYFSTPKPHPMELDHAVIALMRGLDPARWTLICEGVSTVGTQAAVHFACDRDCVEVLLKRLKVATGSDLEPFEALLEVRVADDVPLQTQLLAVRKTE